MVFITPVIVSKFVIFPYRETCYECLTITPYFSQTKVRAGKSTSNPQEYEIY